MKALQKIDNVAFGVLLAGALNSALTGLTRTSVTGRVMGRNKLALKSYYGLVGAATLYKLLRAVGPKTKSEKRMMKVAQLYDQAETYQKQANSYRRTAEDFFKKRLKSSKSTNSSLMPRFGR